MRRTLLPLIALFAVGAAACGGDGKPDAISQPAVSSFAEGTCTVAAPDVLAIGSAGARLGKKATVDSAVLTDLKDAQDGLRTITDGAEPAYKTVLQELVTSIGFVRIRADGNSYEPALGTELMSDYDAVLAACGARS